MKVWERITSIINRMKIRKKLISIYIIAGLVPMLIVSLYLSSSMQKSLVDRATEEAIINTYRLQERLNEAMSISVTISDGLYMDKRLKEIGLRQYENQLDVINAYQDYKTMDEYLRLYKQIESIRLYIDNQTLLNSSQIFRLTDAIKDEDWYQIALENNGRIQYMYRYDTISRKEHLCLVRAIKSNGGELFGVLVINLSDKYLDSLVKEEPFEILIVIENNRIVLSNTQIKNGTVLSAVELFAGMDIDADRIDAWGDSMVIIDSFAPQKAISKIKIVSIVPTKSITRQANEKARMGFIITGISAAISVGLAFAFSTIFTKRILGFRKEMAKAVSGSFDIVDVIDGKDEVVELYEDLNKMILSIKQLVLEVYEEKLLREQMKNRQQEMEFKMLASQINPHFIYNTLETIRMKAYCNEEYEIATIVKKIAQIMRRNLEVSSQQVSLVSEIEFVRSYLDIQKFRFGSKVNFDIKLLCNIEGYEIVPLLLQPIVENAFVHGLEKKEGDGFIDIVIEESSSALIISVEDNGIGIASSKLERIKENFEKLEEENHKSIGLSNVSQRIRLFYGDPYRLDIESKSNVGSKVRLYLPLNEE